MLSSFLTRSFRAAAGVMNMNSSNNTGVNYSTNKNRMVWVDLEMTGLDVNKDHIMEIACLVTDANLTVVAEGPNLVIHQPDSVLDNMNDWCKEHHGMSGLTDAVQKSQTSLSSAESQILAFLSDHTPPGVCPLAGNSVHADRMFLSKYMPRVTNHLHYRIVDVSTIKELCRRWYPKQFEELPKKKLCHRALDDIKESIEELKYYRKSVFIS